MLNLVITDIKNESIEFKSIQKKLFNAGVKWSGGGSDIKEKLNVFNGEELLILIIKDGLLSWTNNGYGMNCLHDKVEHVSGQEFLKD